MLKMKKLCRVSCPQTTDQKAEVRFEANPLLRLSKIVSVVLEPKLLSVLWPKFT